MSSLLLRDLLNGEATAMKRLLAFVTVRAQRLGVSPPNGLQFGDLAINAWCDIIDSSKSQAIGSDREVYYIAERSLRSVAGGSFNPNMDEILRVVGLAPAGPGVVNETSAVDIDELYRDVKTPEQERHARVDLIAIDHELIAHFRDNPAEMYSLKPRRFEELVATLLADHGYTVELTALGADGGIDIIATQKSDVGETLLVVDCKRYAPRRHVGVGIVRSLFGITEQKRATIGLLATTSTFTRDAIEFRSAVPNRLSLKDFADIKNWLASYGNRGKSQS